jgi:molecular chaperone DnaJ
MKHMLPIMFMICDNCNGTGRAGTIPCRGCIGTGFLTTNKEAIDVLFPPGVDTGMQVRIAGKGEPSKAKGGKPGDLYVVVVVKEHSYMKRKEKDIHVEIPLCYSELIKGTQITFKHLNGKDVKITVPKNSKPDTQLRVNGLGMPEVITGRRGDIVVTMKCFVSNPVNAEHEELLRRLMEIEATLVPERNNFER